MKAISLWQPWASLWCSSRKVHETRHWPIRHRGWLLVHAAKRFEKDFDQGDPFREILDDEYGGHWGIDLPTGALVGKVDIIGCFPTETLVGLEPDDRECGDFHAGRYGWRRGAFELFARPIPYRGAQGLFDVPESALPSRDDVSAGDGDEGGALEGEPR